MPPHDERGDQCSNCNVLDAKIKAIEKLMAERDLRYTERFLAQEKAHNVFFASLESWKIHTNEWRQAMNDRERAFLSKAMGGVIGALTVITLIFTILSRFIPTS